MESELDMDRHYDNNNNNNNTSSTTSSTPFKKFKEEAEKRDIIDRLDDLENNIFLINSKIDRLLEVMEKDCKKMTSHIDFVEGVYEKVKTPFTFIMDNVNNIIYSNRIEDGIDSESHVNTSDPDTKEKEKEKTTQVPSLFLPPPPLSLSKRK